MDRRYAGGELSELRKTAEQKSPGLKFDNGKPPMELLSREFLEGTAKVLEFGAKKYASHNWRKGIQYSRLIGAALRHITAFMDGEDLDPESGLSHLHHASCCLMFLSETHALRPQFDDRWKNENIKNLTEAQIRMGEDN